MTPAAQTTIPQHKLKVLVTGAHPGDPEYGCGGAIARFAAQGHSVVMLYLNRGEAGIPHKTPAEAAAIRTAEAEHAGRLLNARPIFAGQVDGRSEINPAQYDAYRQIVVQEQPDVVFTHWPLDNHPDHRANFLLVYDAWLWMKKQFALYYYEVSNGMDTLQFQPTGTVDITAYEALKRTACFAHASLAPELFYPLQEQVSRFRGIESGCQYAEAFIHQAQSPEMAGIFEP